MQAYERNPNDGEDPEFTEEQLEEWLAGRKRLKVLFPSDVIALEEQGGAA